MEVDLLIVGGGINGTAIARDAAGRGLRVLLVEKDDLAAHTSSASSKLVHGGLRYLEQFELSLVRESLREREILLRTAGHLVRPLRFVLPNPPQGRPFWMLKLGLAAYGLLAGQSSLPRARAIKDDGEAQAALRGGHRLLEYWDAWVDDARLVVANAVDAAERGAHILPRTSLLSGRREEGRWTILLSDGRTVRAETVVNAAGAWAAEVLRQRLGSESRSRLRLVKGSHILLPRLSGGDHAYILQQPDGRVVFALPFDRWSLVGTTDVPVERPEDAVATPEETDYLCAAVNRYFVRQSRPEDVIWRFAGVRSLLDDGASQAQDVTRDYRIELDPAPGPKLLTLFGGKLTTARALAEKVLHAIGHEPGKWTRSSALPGSERPLDPNYLEDLGQRLPAAVIERIAAAYGCRMQDWVGDGSAETLGRDLGGGLYEAEIRYLAQKEFAKTAGDILWRRSKLGLVLDPEAHARVRTFLGG